MTGSGDLLAPETASGAPPGCPMCGAHHRIVDPVRMEEHCGECGLVFDTAALVAAPPKASEEGTADGSGRGIGPFVSPGGSRRTLGSVLTGSRDGQGRPLDWHRRYEFQHLNRVARRQVARTIQGPLDRSEARTEIAQCGARLGLPPVVIQEAERVFRDSKVRGLFRGRSLPSSVGATLYAACRRYSIPRTLGEVSKAVGGRRSDVGRAFKVVQRGGAPPVQAVSPRAFLSRYAEELALSAQVRATVEEMLEAAHDDPELSGLSPHGLVAALIYLAAERNGERRSRAQVARVSAVTEVTLRSTSRLVERLMHRTAERE
ncbi:MAG TPA: transcription initiation factor IIB family protein [Thermoplasmata archaeon]|nr:transcription initiation factor IIB family protein [Thermoplasmata archaeon]